MKKFLIVLTICIAGCTHTKASENIDTNLCLSAEESIVIARTEARIIEKYQYSFPESPYPTSYSKGCVKLSFKISSEGLATEIKVEDAIPGKVFNRTAIKALKRYKFDSTNMDAERHILILEFELKK